MSKYIVDMPEGFVMGMWSHEPMRVIDDIFNSAQEVAEVWDIEQYGRANTHDQFYHDKDGLPVKLYAAKDTK